SILIALMLCLTLGGVYATWTFTNDAADIVDVKNETLVALTNATVSGAEGTFTINSNLVLSIDQKAPGDHEAVLLYNPMVEGDDIYLTITFTPAINASSDVKKDAVDAELYFSTTTTMECYVDATGHFVVPADPENLDEGVVLKEIFVFGNKTDGAFTKNVTWSKDETTGVFSATYDLDDIKSMIQLNGKIILDTKADYDAFSALLNGNIVANLTDGTVNGTAGGEQG
ncbi:MAG: hypothetical protein IKU26_05045, partial [Clostridia bacterium]|nr:hypothetical protein [Clostridia bacterium]